MRASKRGSVAFAALAIAAAPACAEPLNYTFDAEHSFVYFELQHFGTSTIRGRIGPVAGSVMLDSAAGRGELSLRIATATLDTGLAVFNARIRQADLMASDAYPEAYFVASRFRYAGTALAEVRGEFTWRGVGRPLSLTALHYGCRVDDTSATEICGGDFEGEILRSDFGATFGLPFVANRVRLRVQVEGRRPVAPPPR